MRSNGHVPNGKQAAAGAAFKNGIQVVNSDGVFSDDVGPYLTYEKINPAGFNYHLISVFGSQSTGKSTLLNNLFGTNFGVMNEEERRQTTKGIWLAKNKREDEASHQMADNILVMDVEGTDGQERGEDQDFERKSALFALATSEILLVNMWETQVGLYNGANMGLLKTVFEVNLQLFVKDNHSIPRSLLFFVIRDHTGRTPLTNLSKTLVNTLDRIWASISKPAGLEESKIQDYFDFAFAALPHKLLQPEKFDDEVAKLGTRFREGYKDPKTVGLLDETSQPLLLPEYHRRIPADGFSVYAKGVWEQIQSNKDLDLPTQQELLAQFRCVEIARECLIAFDAVIVPLETKQADAVRSGQSTLLPALGLAVSTARSSLLREFESAASRYHKGVFKKQLEELETTVDGRLKLVYDGQLNAASKSGVTGFVDAVSETVRAGSKSGSQYDFAKIVDVEKKRAISKFEELANESAVEGTSWSDHSSQLDLFKKDLDKESKRLRQEEMRLLATRVERWIKSKLDESIGLEFNKLGSRRGGSGAPETGSKPPSEADHWDRVWTIFTDIVAQAEKRFVDRAASFDASSDEVEVGLWRLRRKAWIALKTKTAEETAEGNLAMKLRENFEDGFRYDDEGVPRIWRPSDDIDGAFARARDNTLKLIPLLSRFRLAATSAPPPLDAWIGARPATTSRADEEDLAPIGGVDDAEESLTEEMTVLSEARQADITHRFRKTADGIYVEAKRGALGGVTQTPWWMWGLLLVLGQNEIFAVARNPFLILLLAMSLAGAYVTYQMNLWGPIIRMTAAAWDQGLQVGKERLREFLVNSDLGKQAIAMEGRGAPAEKKEEGEPIPMQTLNESGKAGAPESSGNVWDE
ncbi:root hair defective 3 GTP-binding protein [Microthyrium microscopicum]|uniref:Root hair defective 3 GTP-binding protein n=1 Tax=Microthyrium microscopicum TaxID=703497 RepID=A0A6A6TUC3_9PEZI|nr:root hair defective 3 GTP-binding protein [Microthyrium microscopicum]